MSKKFKTLVHNGPIFPDEYTPKGYVFNSETLKPLAEEMLYNYSAKLETEYVKSETFNKNFYKCLLPNLTSSQASKLFPSDYDSLLRKMYNDIQIEKEKKAEFRKEHKADLEKERDARKEKYGYAILDGEKQALGAYLIEGPGIFIARGDNPLLGLWKRRTVPEDVTINFVTKDKSILPPEPPVGHHWKEVISDTNAFHTVAYKVDIGGKCDKFKEIRFGNASTVKADADQRKFDKAAKLLCHMDEMTKYIRDNLNNDNPKIAQCALISWLLQTTGIRIGNTHDLDIQADTVGASTLRKENLWVDDKIMHLHFIGKDSIEFNNEYEVPTYIVAALRRVLKKTKDGEQIFTVDANDVNKFLGDCVEGCTPKLWRTAIATQLMIDALKEQKIKKSMTTTEKMHKFDLASLEVAKKLNHKKAVAKNFNEQISTLDERYKCAVEKSKECELKINASLKELDVKANKAKETWEGKHLEDALKTIKQQKKKLNERLAKSKENVVNLKYRIEFKQQTSDIAIGTSRTNYISPKIAYSISKDLDIPIEKIYTKTLQEKFKWAENTGKDYWKKYPNV